MKPAEIRTIRTELGLSQAQLARLVGVHPLTVSKWERAILSPNAHQQALLDSFRKAEEKNEDIGDDVGSLLTTAGVAFALYVLLSAAFED